MNIAEFAKIHIPALAVNQARHNILLCLIEAALECSSAPIKFWSFGTPGACAIQRKNGPNTAG